MHRESYKEFRGPKNCFSTPMSISKALQILVELRASLLLLFDMSVKEQEEYSWLILNGCKLITVVGQPLIWLR